MPNWACGEMQLVLPTKNVDKFLECANGEQEPCFYRTCFELLDKEDNGRGLTKLTLDVQCAWSAGGCLIDRTETQDYLSLEGVCHEFDVRRLAATFEERGMMFGERITYNQEDGIGYDSYSLPEAADIDFDDEEEYAEEDDSADEETGGSESSITFEDLMRGVTE